MSSVHDQATIPAYTDIAFSSEFQMQTFEERFEQHKTNRTGLLALLEDVDDEKRKIKNRLAEISSGKSRDTNIRGNDRVAAISQYKLVHDRLTILREKIRTTLASIKQAQKTLNRVNNSLTSDYTAAFMTAADEILTDDQLDEVEQRAQEILSMSSCRSSVPD